MVKKVYFLSLDNNIKEFDVVEDHKKDRYYKVYSKNDDSTFYLDYGDCTENYETVVKLKISSLKEQLSIKEEQIVNIKNEIEKYEKGDFEEWVRKFMKII